MSHYNSDHNSDYSDCSEKYSRIRRYKFTEEEDQRLSQLVSIYGVKSWGTIASMMQGRSSRQCRDRWNHYLSPFANNEEWNSEEDLIIIEQLKLVGKQWTYISSLLAGRTSIAVRNRACKLSRKKDADPLIKNLLKDEYKKKNHKHEDVDRIESPTKPKLEENSRIILPPCDDLLKIANVSMPQPFTFDRNGFSFPICCAV